MVSNQTQVYVLGGCLLAQIKRLCGTSYTHYFNRHLQAYINLKGAVGDF